MSVHDHRQFETALDADRPGDPAQSVAAARRRAGKRRAGAAGDRRRGLCRRAPQDRAAGGAADRAWSARSLSRPPISPRRARIDIPARDDDDASVRRVARLARRAAPPAPPRRPARRRSARWREAKAMAASTSASLTARPRAPASRSAPKVSGETSLVCSASQRVGGAGSSTGTIAPPARASGPCRPSLPARRRRSRAPGSASAIPPERPPPPQGTSTIGGARAELRRDLDADAALPFDHVDIVERAAPGSRRAPRRGGRRSPRGSRWRGRRRRSPRPAARVASSFTAGASDGMTMVAAMPSRRAAIATPWAWLPDEKATTPRARSASSSSSSRLVAPRSLKLPPCCRHSAFTQSRRPSPDRAAAGASCVTCAGDALRRSRRHRPPWAVSLSSKPLET